MNLSETDYELIAKNNFVVAKLLVTLVGLATLLDPSKNVLVGALLICAALFSTVSTYAWMSR